MTKMVGRVAKAIHERWGQSPSATLEDFARAAIEAMREPTKAMKESGANGICGIIQGVGESSEKHFIRLWRTAIDAALEEESNEGKEDNQKV